MFEKRIIFKINDTFFIQDNIFHQIHQFAIIKFNRKYYFFQFLSILETANIKDFYFTLSIAKMNYKMMICNLFIFQYNCKYMVKILSNHLWNNNNTNNDNNNNNDKIEEKNREQTMQIFG